jgi:multidrug efflux pump subunit AcrA (membrane-fusion protein)
MKLMKIATTIIILCVVVISGISCSSKSTTTVKTQNYTVQKGSISVAVTGTGNLAYTYTKDLAFEIAGYVEDVLVTEGETVKKGQKLASVDATEWNKTLRSYKSTLNTAQRTLSSKQQALVTAQRAVTTKEAAVTAAQHTIDSKKLAITQAELNVQSANSTLNSIAEVKKAKDAIDEIQQKLMLAGSGDSGYWTSQKDNLMKDLAAARSYYNDIISGAGVTSSTDVALLVAQKAFAVTQAQATLEDAQIAVDDALTAVETAQQALDDAKFAVTNAQLDVNEASATVANAQADLDDANAKSPIITAPFDGFISSVKVSGGDEVYKGSIAMTIVDPNQFCAKINVTEEDVLSVRLGGDATVSLTALSNMSFPAKITKISPTATVSSGVVNYSVTVNITSLTPITTTTTTSQLPAASANRTTPSGMPTGNFTMPSGIPSGNVTAPAAATQTTKSTTSTSAGTTNVTLKDGLSATVDIISQQKSNVLIIPSKAITRSGQNSTVQVVKGTGTETRTVTTGITDGTYTEITDGLAEGEQVQIKASTSSSSSSSSTTKTVSTQQQLQSISGGGPSGGPPPGGGF